MTGDTLPERLRICAGRPGVLQSARTLMIEAAIRLDGPEEPAAEPLPDRYRTTARDLRAWAADAQAHAKHYVPVHFSTLLDIADRLDPKPVETPCAD